MSIPYGSIMSMLRQRQVDIYNQQMEERRRRMAIAQAIGSVTGAVGGGIYGASTGGISFGEGLRAGTAGSLQTGAGAAGGSIGGPMGASVGSQIGGMIGSGLMGDYSGVQQQASSLPNTLMQMGLSQQRAAYGRNQNPATAPDPITGVPPNDISGPRIGNVYSNGTLMPEEMAAAQRSQQANAVTGQALGWGQIDQGPMRGQYANSTVSQLLQAEPVEQTISFEDDMGSKTVKIGEDGRAVITRKIEHPDGSKETRRIKTDQLHEDELARLRAAPGESPTAPAAPKPPFFAPGADRPSAYGIPNQHDPYASLGGASAGGQPEPIGEFTSADGRRYIRYKDGSIEWLD